MTSKRSALSILFLAVVACSSSGGDDTGPSVDDPVDVTGPATATEYCDDHWATYAARWAACEHASAAEAAAVFSPAQRCADPLQAIAAGRATYDASRAGACLSFLETASCDVLEAWEAGRYPQADCVAAIAGQLADGETCYSDDSCASGLCGGDYCPSTCVTPGTTGSSCADLEPCAAGTFCHYALGDATCQPLSQDGEPCLNDLYCAPGLFCDYTSYWVNACRPRATSGGCAKSGECAIGYRCSSANTCVPWLAAGDSCTQGENACGPGLWCGTGGTCIDGPSPSQACEDVNGEDRPCIGGYCASGGTGFLCKAWGAPGETCVISPHCRPTDYCDMSASPSVCTTSCAEP